MSKSLGVYQTGMPCFISRKPFLSCFDYSLSWVLEVLLRMKIQNEVGMEWFLSSDLFDFLKATFQKPNMNTIEGFFDFLNIDSININSIRNELINDFKY